MSRTNSEVEGGPESLPAHSSASHAYTRGVEVLQANISGPGELSLWEFSGQESYFSLYDHFIGMKYFFLTILLIKQSALFGTVYITIVESIFHTSKNLGSRHYSAIFG
jgi:hypothetical protein